MKKVILKLLDLPGRINRLMDEAFDRLVDRLRLNVPVMTTCCDHQGHAPAAVRWGGEIVAVDVYHGQAQECLLCLTEMRQGIGALLVLKALYGAK